MNNEKYNGWSNYETWQAALWLNEHNYLGILLDVREQNDDPDYAKTDAGDVQDFVDSIILGDIELNGFEGLLGDILAGWTNTVNWQELADSFNRDLDNEAAA